MSDTNFIRFNKNLLEDRDADELIGICKGILADGKVVEEEARFLLEWLTLRKEYNTDWLVDTLYDRLSTIFADDIIDESEQVEVFELLSQVIGSPNHMGNINVVPTSLPITTPMPEVNMPNKTFCFTGTFAFGTRKDCWAATEKCGGVPSKSITQKLNYLVIGSIGTSSWKHSTYGRKIEKAIDYRERTGLVIMSEDQWVELVIGDI